MTGDLWADGGEGAAAEGSIRLFLCGDVMTGRGIDQVLPYPCNPHLFEPWARSALRYVELAERASGPIGRVLDFEYPWGDALEVLQVRRPEARIVNLETAVTTSEDWQTGKSIHYRMSPDTCLVSRGPTFTAASLPTTTSWIGGLLAWNRLSRPCMPPACAQSVPGSMRRRRQRRRPLRCDPLVLSIQVAGGLFDRQRSWIDSVSGFEVFAEYVPRPRLTSVRATCRSPMPTAVARIGKPD